jgi:regulator of protease activity HflC (stomatin/prohibitin superfamily)
MKKRMLFCVLFASAIALTGCSRVGPGHVGIVINQAGSNKGVLDNPVKTGWVFYNIFSESVIEYPTYVQTAIWTKSTSEGKPMDESVTFTNKDSMAINADINLSYSLLPEKVPAFYVKFHLDKLEEFTDGFLRNVARDCLNEEAGKYPIEQLMGDNAQFLKDSRMCVETQLTAYGVHVEQFGIVGAPRPPQVVLDQINQKNQAQQIALQKQMELQQVQADANKQVAAAEGQAKAQIAAANGDATANKIRAASITPTILRMRELENQHDMIWRWNGASPTTVVGAGRSGVILQLPNEQGAGTRD